MICTKEQRMKYDAKAKELVKSLTLEQKVHLMSGNMVINPEMMAKMAEMLAAEGADASKFHYNVTPYDAGGVEEKGLAPMKFCDGPRGVVCGVGQTTCFPVSMARGATYRDFERAGIMHPLPPSLR